MVTVFLLGVLVATGVAGLVWFLVGHGPWLVVEHQPEADTVTSRRHEPTRSRRRAAPARTAAPAPEVLAVHHHHTVHHTHTVHFPQAPAASPAPAGAARQLPEVPAARDVIRGIAHWHEEHS